MILPPVVIIETYLCVLHHMIQPWHPCVITSTKHHIHGAYSVPGTVLSTSQTAII
jgi:hypothetical protein